MEASGEGDKGADKVIWLKEEEETLLDVLEEARANGSGADNGFKVRAENYGPMVAPRQLGLGRSSELRPQIVSDSIEMHSSFLNFSPWLAGHHVPRC